VVLFMPQGLLNLVTGNKSIKSLLKRPQRASGGTR
jgi:hypothetical protein